MLVVVVENATASVLLVSVMPLPMVSAPTIPVAPVERIEFCNAAAEMMRLEVEAVLE